MCYDIIRLTIYRVVMKNIKIREVFTIEEKSTFTRNDADACSNFGRMW